MTPDTQNCVPSGFGVGFGRAEPPAECEEMVKNVLRRDSTVHLSIRSVEPPFPHGNLKVLNNRPVR